MDVKQDDTCSALPSGVMWLPARVEWGPFEGGTARHLPECEGEQLVHGKLILIESRLWTLVLQLPALSVLSADYRLRLLNTRLNLGANLAATL